VNNVAQSVWSGIQSAGEFIQHQVADAIAEEQTPTSIPQAVKKAPKNEEEPKILKKEDPKKQVKNPKLEVPKTKKPIQEPQKIVQKQANSCTYLAIDASLDSLCAQACSSDQKECPLKFCICQTAGDPVLSRIRGLVKQISGLIEEPVSQSATEDAETEEPTDWEGIEQTADELSPFWKHMKSLLTENGPNNLSKLWESVLVAEEVIKPTQETPTEEETEVNILPAVESAVKSAGNWFQWAYDQVKVNEE
jgi:hypothetical protein